jgi:acetyl-CoA acetyltransferase
MPGEALAGVAAVVGVGETDYGRDYAAARAGAARPRDAYGYAVTAYKRALADAGLHPGEVDGLVAGPPLACERIGEILGLDPRWSATADHAGALTLATMAIATGAARCVALVYGNDQRSAKLTYGGADTPGAASYLAYRYFAPWGLTSQGALYALMARRYMELHGLSERALGAVAVHQRRHAAGNPNAVMRKHVSVDDYLASPYIAEPLRKLDYCLVNDGGVCLILTDRERSRRLPGRPVTIAGIGRADANAEATALRPRLHDFYHRAHALAAADVYAAAGVGPDDIACVQIYDSFSIHVPVALEGFGFFAPGEAEAFLRGGGLGRVAVNTSGGHLSGSYMQGWGHQVEAVLQLRGCAGARQRPGLTHVQYISDVAGKVTSVIYGKE